MTHVHVFPVDPTLTADEAWKELCIFGQRITRTADTQRWATIRCDGEECRLIEDAR